MTSLGEKLVAKLAASDVACFVPPYMADVYPQDRPAGQRRWPASRATICCWSTAGSRRPSSPSPPTGPSQVAVDADGEVLYARDRQGRSGQLKTDSIDALLDSAKTACPRPSELPAAWNYTWDLVLANPTQLVEDFVAAGRSGIEGKVEEPNAIRGSQKDVYVAPGAVVHPMVVIDAEHGPVYLDEGVEIHPFTRIEGPCYIGKKSILLGTKCREGNSIGPMCRVGGKVEESIIQGYSNKYHDGFLGHAYVGEWVNLGR